MFVQTQETPNPNTLKFLPGKTVSEIGPVQFTNKNDSKNELVRNLLSINGINMVFLGNDFITVKKNEEIIWDDLKQNVISLINDYYLNGKNSVLDKKIKLENDETASKSEIVKKINEVLDSKIRPAVAKDGGDIKFKSFKDGLVTVELKGSCSGCPSSIMTLKQGVQNLLCHYIPEIKRVEAL